MHESYNLFGNLKKISNYVNKIVVLVITTKINYDTNVELKIEFYN